MRYNELMTRDMTRETLAMTRDDSDSKLMTRDSTRDSALGKSDDSRLDSTVMTRAQLCQTETIHSGKGCHTRSEAYAVIWRGSWRYSYVICERMDERRIDG